MLQMPRIKATTRVLLASTTSFLALQGCGGSSTPSDTSEPSAMTSAAAPSSSGTNEQVARYQLATSTATCESTPAIPSLPASTINIQSFGAIPNDGIDDSAAIQRAFDSLTPGQWLVFSPGQYDHNRTLNLRVADVTLWGKGATLNATNPADQALMLKADRDRVYGFTMTATTDHRRTEGWTARLVIFGDEAKAGYVSGVVLQDNQILPANTQPGTPASNSSSSAGILVYKARDFTIAGNTVKRSLADGIHITAASRNGRILGNTVAETGDDMIAMVTYLPSNWRANALADATWASTYLANENVKQIVVANNSVGGQYWGRGIAVVGGDSISIKNNTITNTTYGAGVMVGREHVYNTTGSSNVVVSGNAINHVQTTAPAYVPTGSSFTGLNANLSSGMTTGQGGIEVLNISQASDLSDTRFRPAVLVSNVLINNNTVNDTIRDGIRVGAYSDGQSISDVSITNNHLAGVRQFPISGQFQDGSKLSAHCSLNTLSGYPLTPLICTSPVAPVVSGATLDCTKF